MHIIHILCINVVCDGTIWGSSINIPKFILNSLLWLLTLTVLKRRIYYKLAVKVNFEHISFYMWCRYVNDNAFTIFSWSVKTFIQISTRLYQIGTWITNKYRFKEEILIAQCRTIASKYWDMYISVLKLCFEEHSTINGLPCCRVGFFC